jgi:hypothetical protein
MLSCLLFLRKGTLTSHDRMLHSSFRTRRTRRTRRTAGAAQVRGICFLVKLRNYCNEEQFPLNRFPLFFASFVPFASFAAYCNQPALRKDIARQR